VVGGFLLDDFDETFISRERTKLRAEIETRGILPTYSYTNSILKNPSIHTNILKKYIKIFEFLS
jgi:hypothetical protein